jgi:hypothetical protein
MAKKSKKQKMFIIDNMPELVSLEAILKENEETLDQSEIDLLNNMQIGDSIYIGIVSIDRIK